MRDEDEDRKLLPLLKYIPSQNILLHLKKILGSLLSGSKEINNIKH